MPPSDHLETALQRQVRRQRIVQRSIATDEEIVPGKTELPNGIERKLVV
jgi:hypothetical protein